MTLLNVCSLVRVKYQPERRLCVVNAVRWVFHSRQTSILSFCGTETHQISFVIHHQPTVDAVTVCFKA